MGHIDGEWGGGTKGAHLKSSPYIVSFLGCCLDANTSTVAPNPIRVVEGGGPLPALPIEGRRSNPSPSSGNGDILQKKHISFHVNVQKFT
jgi:hypothetical protein